MIGLLFGLNGFAADRLSILLDLFVFLLLTALPGALAIILGFIGISRANRMNGLHRPLGIWGVVLGFSPLVFLALGVFLRSAIFGAS